MIRTYSDFSQEHQDLHHIRRLPFSRKKPKKNDVITGGPPFMRKLALLGRGESLDSIASKIKSRNPTPESQIQNPIDDHTDCKTERIGHESPEMVWKPIRRVKVKFQPSDVYAGATFVTSPSPKSLPLPSFFNKKVKKIGKEIPCDVIATTNLKSLLHLDVFEN